MRALLVFGVAALAAGSVVAAKPHSTKLTWGDAPPALPSGAKMAVVSGNPGKAGMFKVELKVPAGYVVPPHWHPTTETVKLLSGSIHYGMSAKHDMKSAKALQLGHSVVMKAKMPHWIHAAEATTLEVSGMGPFQITYVDPKDDPRKK